MKGDGDERAQPGEGEGALLVADAQESAAEVVEGEGDPGHDAEEGSDDPCGDEKLEEVSVGGLDDAGQLAGLDDAERLAEGAEARAEDGVALPGLEGVGPDEDARVGPEVAGVGGEEAQERARPEGRDDEEEAQGDAADERGPLGPPAALVAVEAGPESEAGEEEGGGRRGEHPSPGVGEGEGRGEEPPEDDAEGRSGEALLEPGGVHGPALAGTTHEGDDEPAEGDGETDTEVAGEMVGVEEGAGDAARFLLRGDGPGGLTGHAGEEDPGEEPPAGAGGEERGRREEGGGEGDGQERNEARLDRRDGEAGRRGLADAGSGENRGRAAVNFETRRRQHPNEAGRKGQKLKETEKTQGQEAGRREESGARQGGGAPPAKRHGRSGEKRHHLDAEAAPGLDPAEREGRRGGKGEHEGQAGDVSRVSPGMRGPFTKPMSFLQALALLALGTPILGAAAPADDFYLVRLQAGRAEAAAGRHFEAIDDFRIASFGFLDQPALLMEGLARLALAQEAAGKQADAEATLRRLVEIEKRFSGWAQADLEPETRAAFMALLSKRLGPATPNVLTAPVAPPATPTPVPTRIPTPVPAPAPPVAEVAAPVSPVATEAAPRTGAGAPAVPSVATAGILAESKSLVAQGRYAENFRKLASAVAADPADRDLSKALLEGAVLTKEWGIAVAQVAAIKPFRDGEEPWMFYGAVALQETGAASEARELAEKALPRLARSPFVDFYARRILGTPPNR